MEHLQPSENLNKAPRMPEKIASAAIKFNGEMIPGVNHALAILQLEKVHPDWQKLSPEAVEEGFLTSFGRFVDRQEAAEIADRAEQTSEESIATRRNPRELDSSEISPTTIH